jgi:hypothetical protein
LIFFLILSLQPLKLSLSVAETIPYFAIKEVHGKGMKQASSCTVGAELEHENMLKLVESSLSLGYRFVGFNG